MTKKPKGILCWVTRDRDDACLVVWQPRRAGPGDRPVEDDSGQGYFYCPGSGGHALICSVHFTRVTGLRIRRGSIQLVEFYPATIVKGKRNGR